MKGKTEGGFFDVNYPIVGDGDGEREEVVDALVRDCEEREAARVVADEQLGAHQAERHARRKRQPHRGEPAGLQTIARQ